MSFDLRLAKRTQAQLGRVVWFDPQPHTFIVPEEALADMVLRGGGAPPMDPAFPGTPDEWLALWLRGADNIQVLVGDRYDTPLAARPGTHELGDIEIGEDGTVKVFFGDQDWFRPLILRPATRGGIILPGIVDGYYTGTGDKLSFTDATLGVEIVNGVVLQAPTRARQPQRVRGQLFTHNRPQSIAEDNAGVATGSGATATINSFTVGTGAQLFGALHWYRSAGGRAVTSITFNGVALTDIATAAQGGEQMAVGLRFLAAPDVGSFNLVSTLNGTADNIMAGAMSMTGSDGVGTGVTATGNSTAPAATVTGVTAGSWVVGAASKYNAIACDDVQEYAQSGTLSSGGGYVNSAAGGNETLNFSGSGSYLWGIVAVELFEDVGGGGGDTVAPVEATSGHTADVATFSQVHSFQPADADHGHTADATALPQVHSLEPADADHGHTADGAIFDLSVQLPADDATHGHSADAAGFVQVHTLAVDEALHGHLADATALPQTHVLAIQDALHGHAADPATFAAVGALNVNDANHAHAADPTAFLQVHILDAGDAAQGHSADATSFSQVHTLAVADALHGHTADATAATEGDHTLAIDDALQGHLADATSFAQGHVLAIADASHAQTADNATLAQAHLLDVQDAAHGQAADTASLGAGMGVSDAVHGHTVEQATFSQIHVPALADAVHAHQAEQAVFTQVHVMAVDDAGHGHTAANAGQESVSPTSTDQRVTQIDVTPQRAAAFDVTGRTVNL